MFFRQGMPTCIEKNVLVKMFLSGNFPKKVMRPWSYVISDWVLLLFDKHADGIYMFLSVHHGHESGG